MRPHRNKNLINGVRRLSSEGDAGRGGPASPGEVHCSEEGSEHHRGKPNS